MKLQQDKKSGLKYLFNAGNPDHPTVIMLHGYGANAQDLYSISELRFIKELDLNWLFLDGPLVPQELQAFGGRAWFTLDIAHFQTLIQEGRFKEFYSREPENINALHEKLSLFIESMRLEAKDFYIGGFSQGAMVATDYLYSSKIKPKGLIHLSGTVIRQNLWMSGSLVETPIFQSHGKMDPVLPVQGAQHFKSISKSKKHHLEIFQGGHEIPLDILLKLKDFLN